MNYLSGYKTYIVAIVLALNAGFYATGIYTKMLGSPADKNLHDTIAALLAAGGFAALKAGQVAEATKVENVVTGKTAPREIPS